MGRSWPGHHAKGPFAPLLLQPLVAQQTQQFGVGGWVEEGSQRPLGVTLSTRKGVCLLAVVVGVVVVV